MASTYLSRTLGTATNRKIWTFSTWIKRNNITSTNHIFGASVNPTTYPALEIAFTSSGVFLLSEYNGSGYNIQLNTNRLFRDVSAWYHIVVSVDTTQSTASDRVKIYVNGVQETSFSTANYYSQNTDPAINNASIHTIGKHPFSSESADLDAILSHFHFIDGTAYDASTFGETDATTGIWKPKTAPSVTYGTNGFFLKFENSGSMGTDSSGNGNNFTVNGTMTQTIDTPSNVFATFNALTEFSGNGMSNGNLKFTNSTSTYSMRHSTLAVSQGKYYAEFKITDMTNGFSIVGISDANQFDYDSFMGSKSRAYSYRSDGTKGNNSTSSSYGNTFTTGDIIGVAMDLDNNKLYFSKNGTWQNSGDPTSGATGTGSAFDITDGYDYCIGASSVDNTTDQIIEANFGNGYFGTTAVSSAENPDDGIGIFEHSVPTGYKALCTKSINAQEYS